MKIIINLEEFTKNFHLFGVFQIFLFPLKERWLYDFPISLWLLLLCVGYTIWCLYAVCSHALIVQLVMCHQPAQIYLDVGHYPESAGRLWQLNYLLVQNWFEWNLLFASALMQNPSLSVSVSLSCSDRASVLCSSLCLFVHHTCTQTQIHTCVC